MKKGLLLVLLMLCATLTMVAQTTPAAEGAVVYVSIEERSNVQVIITDSNGRDLATVHQGILPAGEHSIHFDRNAIPAGDWYYRLKVEKASDAEIQFTLPERSYVRLTIVNEKGESIVTVHDGVLDAGDHAVRFDAEKLPAGEWSYRVSAEKVEKPS